MILINRYMQLNKTQKLLQSGNKNFCLQLFELFPIIIFKKHWVWKFFNFVVSEITRTKSKS